MAAGSQKNYRVHEQREFTGSIPNTRIIAFKKPYKESPDAMLVRRNRQNERRSIYEEYVRNHNYHQFVGINEYRNDCTMVKNVMKRRLVNKRKTFEELIDKKRERLAILLQSEAEKYHAEFETLFPTNEEKLTAFLKNVNELKRRKIEEMNRVAAEMYEKRWTKNCDELREHLRGLSYKACAKDNLASIKLRDKSRTVVDEDNKFLMHLMDKKLEAEEVARENKAKEKSLANRQASELNRQLAKEKAEEEALNKKRNVEEGLELFHQHQEDEKLRKQKEREEKLKNLANARKDLNKQVLLREKKLALEKEVNDIMNAKFLEERALFQQNEEEKQRKLRNQFMAAKAFDAKIKAEEAAKEKEFEACVKTMMDAATKKTNDLLRKREEDQKVRVMDAKYQCDKLVAYQEEKKKAEKEAKLKENEAMANLIQETADTAENHRKYYRKFAQAHQTDLVAQIAYNQHLRDLDQAEKQRERDKMHAAEREYNARIKKALEDATIGNVHPARMKALGSARLM